tara:strand:- start:68239 stop:69150 length:912 start_codon:yes stop_codon:yes gene_type:complete
MTPEISIVIPVFNKERYITETLKSVAAQTFSRYEVIVIDDGSTDDSRNLILQAGLPNLRLVEQKNSGVSIARNRGIELARAQLIAFLDADDIWYPDHLRSLWMQYQKFPDAVLYCDRFVEIDRLVADYSTLKCGDGARVVSSFFLEMTMGRVAIFTSAAMAKRDILLKISGFPPGYSRGEDLATWINLSLEGDVVVSDFVGVHYLRATGGLTSNYIKKPDIAMKNLIGIASDLKCSQELALELYNRISLAHSLDALLAGDRKVARFFLKNASSTKIFRKRYIFLNILVCFPSSKILKLLIKLK